MERRTARTSDFHVRMTSDERGRLDAAAEKCGLTRSDLIRLLAKLPAEKVADGSIRVVAVDTGTMARIHREMRRFGTNLNQAAHALNSIRFYLGHGSLKYEYLSISVPEIERNLELVGKQQADLQEDIAKLESAVLVGW